MGTTVQTYSIQVQDRTTRKVIYSSGSLRVEPPRDLFAAPLRVGLRFDKKGPFLVHILAASSANLDQLPSPTSKEPYLFWAGLLNISGTTQGEALLLPVAPDYDQDRDHFPDMLRWTAALPEAQELYKDHPELLDCVDAPIATGDILPATVHNYDIHPLALQRCNVRWRPSVAQADPKAEPAPMGLLDTTCGGQPRTCLDEDGDGESAETDCDDKDPRRFHGNARPRNCCQCTDPKSCRTNHAKLPDLNLCSNPQRCNSDIDYDCSGQRVECFKDDDCDGYSPDSPIPDQRDCDDTNPSIYPGAPKNCQDSSKDWSCDGHPECVPCDKDGDGFQRFDAVNGCPKDSVTHQWIPKPDPSTVDCNDEDRGVFPLSTDPTGKSQTTLVSKDLNAQEGGSIAGALRGLCRNRNPDKTAQDADCDNVAWRGCVPQYGVNTGKPCDLDGDGFPQNNDPDCNNGATKLPLDCDDSNPTTFPGAPEKCASASNPNPTDSNCDKRSVPCTSDKDGDGYQGKDDCNDTDREIYPFATERCNGIDDDCDGLIDEGNPDLNGQPLIQTLTGGQQSIRTCKDSGVGQCAQRDGQGGYTGHCVCSGMVPITLPDPDETKGCPGAGSGAAFAPRCFSAYQPTKTELCNGLDDDCDGIIPDNEKDLDGDGYIACASDNTLPLRAGLKGRGDCDDSNPDSYPGAAELCDGKDNDCNGSLPGDEADPDKDGYLLCTTCRQVTHGVAANVKGCSDCDDANPNIYPTAPEICDGWPNDCNAPLVDNEKDPDNDRFLACTKCDKASPYFNKLFNGCGDCDDNNPASYPGAPEICDGLLNNASANDGTCGNAVATNEADVDGDKYMSCTMCGGNLLKMGLKGCGDCDDKNVNIYPTAPEICDGFLDNSDANLGTCTAAPPLNEVDSDGDKFLACSMCSAANLKKGLNGCNDCDDFNPTIYPGAPEICDGNVNNCGQSLSVSEADADGDKYIACAGCDPAKLKAGLLGCRDCDDVNPRVFPGATEICDGYDNSCLGTVPVNESDVDKDRYIACGGCDPAKLKPGLSGCGDCDDANANTHPNALEICDGYNNTCSGTVPDNEKDKDSDKFLACSGCDLSKLKPGMTGCNDCDDANPNTHPGAVEICDGNDNGCNGSIPDSEKDFDKDKWLACSGCSALTLAAGLSGCNDCDDFNPATYPGAPEICDGNNNSCAGTLPNNESDLDGDKYLSCNGCVSASLKTGLLGCNDCDDNNRNTYPGAAEICDGYLNNCGGSLPANEQDTDNDKWLACKSCSAGNLKPGFKGCSDCDDSNANSFPGAPEICDGYNNNCSGTLPASEQDLDNDKYLQCAGCAAGSTKPGLSGCNDCDDFNANTYPGAPEICDGHLNNCGGTLPDNEKDTDADAYLACAGCIGSNLKTGVLGCNDCDDANRNTYPGATEICDGNLNNCGGTLPVSEKDLDADNWLACSGCAAGNLKTGVKGCNDCNDNNNTIYPGATEICDGYNNSCSGTLPAGEADADKDNWMACAGCVPGMIKPGLAGCNDCDDANANTYPGATEICDGNINNCGGALPANETDGDGDTYVACGPCVSGNLKAGLKGCNDCDDTNKNIYPSAPEICDGYANSCGNPVPVNEQDLDNDKWLACSGCAAGNLKPGLKGCSDCVDSNDKIFPGATEYCDGLNNACSPTYNQTADDGKGDCKVAPNTTCCALVPACLDVQTNFDYCGGCVGHACDSNSADRCFNGACMCANDAACPNGSFCVPGVGCAGCRNNKDCSNGQTCCSKTCKALQTDITNCGSCGNVCPVPANGKATCGSGSCGVSCNAGYSVCSGNTCKDLQNDAQNCGACGVKCAAGQTCCSGACKDLTTDPNNCATCGSKCSVPLNGSATCTASTCGIVCDGGYTACNTACKDLQNDALNCGMCGKTCAAGETCCAGACKNLQRDTSHCGSCGTVCPTPLNGVANCNAGVCGVGCDAGFSSCSGACKDLMNDTQNCGKCGTTCGTGQLCCTGVCKVVQTDTSNCGTCANVCTVPGNGSATCSTGTCGISCNAGFTNCTGACKNLQNDAANCGVCGKSCNAGETCCSGVCKDLTLDTSNCGTCGKVCAVPANGAAACDASVCGVSCNAGYTACSLTCKDLMNDVANCGTCGKTCLAGQKCCTGVCKTVQTDTSNCGTCGNVCSPPANSAPTCTTGTCGFSCNTGYTACSGACKDLMNDAANCGTCGKACAMGQTCCAGACKDLQTDVSHCGTCGTACGVGEGCCSGTCLGLQSDVNNCGVCGKTCAMGQNCCTGACSDPTSDANNCGACGTKCGAGGLCCTSVCKNAQTDITNCGTCGNVCSTPTNGAPTCGTGSCGIKCDTGYTACGAACKDLMNDAANCGVCGKACAMGQTCCAGACKDLQADVKNCGTCGTACGTGEGCCSGACKGLQSDVKNCGVCGTVCATGQNCCTGLCSDPTSDANNCGACGTSCGAGGLCCASVCKAGQTDIANCGMCGKACPAPTGGDATCAAATCGTKCPMGQGDCGGVCKDLLSDKANCGGCNILCEMNESCCSGACKKLQEDPLNCNACGAKCDVPMNGAATCTAGACGITCDASYSPCGATCKNLKTDNSNCGTCDNVCMGDNTCCSGSCVDKVTNKSHCGACGKVCAAPTNATPTCAASTCGYTCDASFTDCSGMCVDTKADKNNCGMCDKKCADPANGTGVCTAGACGVTCSMGYSACGMTCHDLQTDSLNCGTCGTKCAAGANACCGGLCGDGATCPTCGAGETACGESCVNLKTNAAHCGACGKKCNAGDTCCNGACVTTDTDKMNCGSCGKVCDPNLSDSCVVGVCKCGADPECAGGQTCKMNACGA